VAVFILIAGNAQRPALGSNAGGPLRKDSIYEENVYRNRCHRNRRQDREYHHPRHDANSTCCVAPVLGLASSGNSPVLGLCRLAVEHGHDPHACMQVFRGTVLALTIRSIGEAAQLEINSKGTRFVRRPGVRTASPVRKSTPADPRTSTEEFAATARPGR
jgi:hypothetical protein